MGKLMDALRGKNPAVTTPDVDANISQVTTYNRFWLNRISNSTGFIINEDGGKVDGILSALNRKDGHCPCGGNGDQFLCPCVIMRDKGLCKCGLFHNIVPLTPRGASSARVIRDDKL
jgi:hypothetical protein